jgi:hypothetical protein
MPLFETPIPTGGENGNVFVILAIATSYMRRLGFSEAERQKLRDRVHASHSYMEACKIIKEWFPLKPDPTRPKKPKMPKGKP